MPYVSLVDSNTLALMDEIRRLHETALYNNSEIESRTCALANAKARIVEIEAAIIMHHDKRSEAEDLIINAKGRLMELLTPKAQVIVKIPEELQLGRSEEAS